MTDSYRTFTQVANAMAAHLAGRRDQEALELMEREGSRFPAAETHCLYLRSCLLARLGRGDDAVSTLEHAVQKGYWFSEEQLRQSPSLANLSGSERFEAVVAEHLARGAVGRQAARVATIVLAPEGSTGSLRTLALLHGHGENARMALQNLTGARETGWLVAAIQSSQAVAGDSFAWTDEAVATRDVTGEYGRLLADARVDRTRTVLGGFSMGAEVALKLALSGRVPCRGVLLLGPGGPDVADPDVWAALLGDAPALRAAVLVGADDRVEEPGAVKALADQLAAAGVPTFYRELPGHAHEYPNDAAALQEALEHLLGAW